MKKTTCRANRRAAALLLLAAMLLTTACQAPQDPSVDSTPAGQTETAEISSVTEPETEPETKEEDMNPPRETYEDLSFTVPDHAEPEDAAVTVTAEGDKTSSDAELDFTAISGLYIVSSTKIPNCHDSGACEECGYVETEDGGAYLLSSHGSDQGGITVTLATPIPASAVTGMAATFKTTVNAPACQLRILRGTETNNAAFINSCGSMEGAVDHWKTVDLGVEDYADLADTDGYIRSFQIYFRDKNDSECYLQSIRISVSPQEYLNVTEIEGSFLYKQAAALAIAETIAERFEFSGVKAEITVETSKYRQNSGKTNGGLYYTATAVLADGTTLTGKGNVTIPTITGEWLDTTRGNYGSSHDAKGQWQDTFDNGGMVLLTDNAIDCAEGMRTMEYAVIPADGAYDDPALVWLPPHILEMGGEGFTKLFVNAYLDYGDSLTEGGKYRFLLRGVSNNDNYILHLDIPFSYSTLSEDAVKALTAAYEALEKVSLIMPAETQDKAAAAKESFEALISNQAITVSTELVGEGVNSMRIRAMLSYNAPVTAARLPAYTLDGEALTAVYSFGGTAFTVEGMTVPFRELTASIDLLAPYDGKQSIILASEHIYKHAMAPLKEIEDVDYDYLTGEYCTPAPVVLEWSDENGSEGKTYTVTISESPDLSSPVRVLTVTETVTEVYNLNIGQQYYWQVTADGEASLIFTFTTADGYPRFLHVDGVSNFRDIGGYTTADGKKVKQNLVYRSAHLDTITDEGRKTALELLGIKTDLDIRGGSSAPLGSSVEHVSIAMQWYAHIFTEENYEVVRQTISSFAYEENYPMIFHCSMGRDRTGTTAFLILGLLGVDEDTLRHEYYASSFSAEGRFNPNEFPALISNISGLKNGFYDFGESTSTLQERIEAYLLHIGVTAEEIASIREILLED